MRRIALILLAALLLGGCQKAPAAPAIATPGPKQTTQIQGLFRGEGEPEESVELDSEHGYWAYRSDTLGMEIEFWERELSEEAVTAYCLAEIAWRDGDPLREALGAEAAEDCILYMPETERLTLLSEGEPVAGGGERAQRAGYGRLPDGGYIAIALSSRHEGESRGLSAEELAELFLEAGCDWAVQLAEGPAAAMLFMGIRLNDPMEGEPAQTDGGVGWGVRH